MYIMILTSGDIVFLSQLCGELNLLLSQYHVCIIHCLHTFIFPLPFVIIMLTCICMLMFMCPPCKCLFEYLVCLYLIVNSLFMQLLPLRKSLGPFMAIVTKYDSWSRNSFYALHLYPWILNFYL